MEVSHTPKRAIAGVVAAASTPKSEEWPADVKAHMNAILVSRLEQKVNPGGKRDGVLQFIVHQNVASHKCCQSRHQLHTDPQNIIDCFPEPQPLPSRASFLAA